MITLRLLLLSGCLSSFVIHDLGCAFLSLFFFSLLLPGLGLSLLDLSRIIPLSVPPIPLSHSPGCLVYIDLKPVYGSRRSNIFAVL